MVNPPVIELVRTSLITTETLPGLLDPQPGQPSPAGPVLNKRDQYIAAFKSAQTGNGAPQLPWPAGRAGHGPSSHFWHYYLRKQDLSQVDPALAWERLVPLRVDSRRFTCVADDKIRLNVESYAYPHGNATVATITVRDSDQLDASVDRVLRARGSEAYAPVPSAGAQASTLGSLLAGNEGSSRALRFGGAAGAAEPYDELFALTTPIRVSDVDPKVPLEEGGPIHLALEGWCTFSSTWQEENPQKSLKERQVPTKRASFGTMLYAHRGARVLWFPERSTKRSESKPPHSLGCLHRNFTHASMQVQSLLGLARWADDHINRGKALSPESDEIVKSCAIVLGLLIGPVSDIYQSHTVERQIFDSGLIPQIKNLRMRYGPNWKPVREPQAS